MAGDRPVIYAVEGRYRFDLEDLAFLFFIAVFWYLVGSVLNSARPRALLPVRRRLKAGWSLLGLLPGVAMLGYAAKLISLGSLAWRDVGYWGIAWGLVFSGYFIRQLRSTLRNDV
jgi:hypothetical protein